jgi:hypothetical protein
MATLTMAVAVAVFLGAAAEPNATDACSSAGCSSGCLVASTGVCYPDMTKNDCHAHNWTWCGKISCTGRSAGLAIADCEAWQSLYVRDTPQGTSAGCSRSDPCSCAAPGTFEKCNLDGNTGQSPCVRCAGGNIVSIDVNNGCVWESLATTIPTQLTKLTELGSCPPSSSSWCGLGINTNNFTGTIPSELAKLTKIQTLNLVRNKLTGTIPSELAQLSSVTGLWLCGNRLTGIVPPLPFGQYTSVCGLDHPDQPWPDHNHFKCPLPAGSEQCKRFGAQGVHCS